MYGSWDAGTWVWMMVVMLLLAGALIVGTIAVVRALRDRRPAEPYRSARALDALDDRFARGEIDADEYAERRRVLTERNDATRV